MKKKIGWTNPETGEKLIHSEKNGRKDLLYGIHGDRGAHHGHAVWRGDVLEYHRDETGNVTADASLERGQTMGRETSRKTIEQGMDKSRKEYKKYDEEFEKDVRTKKAISEAARASSVDGTDEGMKPVKQHVERAGAAADKKFRVDQKGQTKETETKVKPREKNLQEMTAKTKQDLQRIQQASSKAEVKESKQALKESATAASEDAKYTEKKAGEQKKDRTKAEQTAKQKAAQMKSAPVKFRK